MLRQPLAAAALCVLAVGCSDQYHSRPIVMCGTTLSPGGGGGAVVLDEVPTDPASSGPSSFTANVNTLIVVSASCSAGADVTFAPGGVTFATAAYAKDGKPVMFSLSSKAAQQSVIMTVAAHGHTRTAHVLVITYRASS